VIALVRVDNRLLHGQILETWVPRLGAREVVVADDDAAQSPLARAAMTLCVPPGLVATIAPLGEVDWAALAADARPILVLVRDVEGLVRARARGLAPGIARKVNLGNVHYEPGRRAVTPSVFLTEGEVAALRVLADEGFEVAAQAVPSEPPAGFADIERRYAAAR
jgi:PTS system N-acetylgalactosamine-specific IIB component